MLLITLGAFAVAAQNAFASTYFDENAFSATTNYSDRSGFIIDQAPVLTPPAFIPASVFLQQNYLDYYSKFGFDRNFFTWIDSTGAWNPGQKATWSGCTAVDQGQPTHQTKQPDGRLLCDPAWTVTDDNGLTVRSLVQTGPVHGFFWRDSNNVVHFVSTVCGNWTHPIHPPPPTLSGNKFEDLNGNGSKDSGEPPVSGFVFDLQFGGQPVLDQFGHQVTATSDVNGQFTFTLDADNLTAGGKPIGPGEYEVTEEGKPGWVPTTPQPVKVQVPAGSVGDNFTLPAFGNFRTGSISGRKFEDRNADGSGTGDPGLPGWTIKLSGTTSTGQPLSLSTVTGADGSYSFSPVPPGTYTISEVPQAGWTQSAPASGTYSVTLASGQQLTGLDFGNHRPKITTLLIPGTPTVQIGTIVRDSAQLSEVTPDAGGTVTYKFYSSLANCQAGINGTGAGTFNVTAGVVPKSKQIAFNTLGTFYWQATYSGDVNNGPAASDCSSEVITVIPPPAQLVICKANANGASGVAFNYTIIDSIGATHAVVVTGGSCSSSITLPSGTTVIAEDLSSGQWSVQSIVVTPFANLVSSNLQTGTATVNLTTDVTTTVTYTNQQVPRIEVCKWSTNPQLIGTIFNFTIGATPVSAVAGSSKAGAGCSFALPVSVGQSVTITESVPAGVKVAGIDVSPNTTLNSANGAVAKVTVGPGLNIVYYEDEIPPPQTGFIEVCKDAADQFVSRTDPFIFTITDKNGVTTTVPIFAGQCSTAIQVAAGNVTVTETIVPPNMLAAVTAIPASALGPVNLVNGTAIVVVPVSSTTTGEVQVHFLNTTQTTQVKICKVITASSGVLSGQTFTFNVTDATGDSTVSIIALVGGGQCKILPHTLPLGSTITVTEPAIPYVGADGGPPNTALSKTITVGPGINTISFTNQAFGQFEICKTTDQGNSVSGVFTFDYAGVSVGNTTHGSVQVAVGHCSFPIIVPVDNYTIAEEATTGFSFSSVTATGPFGDSRVIVGGNPLVISVPYFNASGPAGGETLVTFVNKAQVATIKVCKLIDPGSTTPIGGRSFAFKIWTPNPAGNVLLTSASVAPPYPGPASCVLLGSYPVLQSDGTPTKLLVGEVLQTGVQVESISLNGNATVNTNNSNNNGKINFTVTGPGVINITYTNEAPPSP
jgi:hypothetical protein